MAGLGKPSSLLLAVCVSLLVAACGGGEADKEKGPAQKAALTVTVAVARQEALPRVVQATGTVSAFEEVPVASETGGLTAVRVLAEEGQFVRKGQPLVQMNDTVLRAQLAQATAQVASARATLNEADRNLARARELAAEGFLSQAGLDQRVSAQQTAAANLQAAQAAVQEVTARLAQAVVRAPVSGQIVSRTVVVGQIVQPGAELFRMSRAGALEMDAQVPETELPLLRAGMSARVSAEQAGETTGVIRVVTPEVDPRTRLGVARISLPAGSGFRPGYFARAAIDAGAAPAVVVPASAVVYRDGDAGVFVVGGDGRARFREVQTGVRSGANVALTSGVNAGERVAVQGAGFLVDGDLVRVDAGAAPATAPAATKTASR